MLESLTDWDHHSDEEGPCSCPLSIRHFVLLNPRDEADQEERLVHIVQHKHSSDCIELWELPSVNRQDAFHESILIVRVLVAEVIDVFFKQLSLVTDFETVRQLSILLKADLLGHGAFEEWPGVIEAELIPERGAFSHKLPLENFVQLFLNNFFVVYLLLLHCF